MFTNNRGTENITISDVNFKQSSTHYMELDGDSTIFSVPGYRMPLAVKISFSSIVYMLLPHTVGKLYKRHWKPLNNPFYYTIPPLRRNSKPLSTLISLGASIIPQKLILSISTLHFGLSKQPHPYGIGCWFKF
jgi:hypothetical protein